MLLWQWQPCPLSDLRFSEPMAKPPAIRLGVTLTILVVAAVGACTVWFNLPLADADRVWQEAEASIRAGRLEETQAGLRRLESLRQPTPEDWILKAQLATARAR